ncbi:hypothetical protein L9F63_016702, partial [Diploptera punctata]
QHFPVRGFRTPFIEAKDQNTMLGKHFFLLLGHSNFVDILDTIMLLTHNTQYGSQNQLLNNYSKDFNLQVNFL